MSAPRSGDSFAADFPPAPLPHAPIPLLVRSALAAATFATATVALWLFMVCAVVLPERDPGHLPLWLGVACGTLAFAGLTGAFVSRGSWRRALAPLVALGSLAAIVFGAAVITSSLRAAHFEGYALLIGVVVAGHGLCALGSAALVSIGGRTAQRR